MIAYLDNSATTRPCESSIQRVQACMSGGYFNPSALYAPAIEAERALDACRDALRAPIRAAGYDVLFTSGGTEANNLAILGFADALRGKRHLITSAVEHPSVAACFDALEAQGHRVTRIPSGMDGALDLRALEQALDGAEPPVLCSIMMVQNETGAIHDLAAVSRLLRSKAPECRFHVDAVQGYLRLPLDARPFDMITVSAHKVHGPKGAGALLVRKGVRLAPRQIGGGQQNAMRSGTENTPGVAGFLGAVEHMTALTDAAGTMMRLKLRLVSGIMAAVPDAQINGPMPEEGAPNIVNISFPGVRGEVLLHALEADGVYCSTGSACSSRKRKLSAVLLAMGVSPERAESALRFSLCPDTSEPEIDYAVERIASHCALLKRFKRR